MNNLRLVVIVAIFIVLIIVLFYNRIIGSLKSGKQKDIQAAKPSDDRSHEERDASDVVGDFFGKEESTEKEKSKVNESTAGPVVEIEDQPAVNYEKIEADLKAVGDEVTTKIEAGLKAMGGEVTTKIEGLILKVEAVEKEVLNKVEDVIDIKIQEVSNKINDRISEAISAQMNSINPVSEERVDSLRKEVPADILHSEDTVVPDEIKEKEQADTVAPSEEIEKKISGGDVGESVDFDIQNVLEEEPVGMTSTEEPKELVEEKVEFEEKKERNLQVLLKDRDILEKLRLFVRYQLDAFDILPFDELKTVPEEKKEKDLEVPSEVEKDVNIDEKEPIETNTSTGEIEEKISEGDVGESVDFDIEKFLEEEPVSMPSTEEPEELVEEKVEFEEKNERDLEASVKDSDILEKASGSLQMDEDSFDILPSDESKTVPEEKKEKGLDVPSEIKKDLNIDEKEPIETNTSTGEIEEKISEGDVGESVDFDIEKFLEEEPVGMPSTEEPKESVEEKVEFKFKEEKEEGLELSAEETAAHEENDEKEIGTIAPPGDIEEKALAVDKGQGTEEKKQSTVETSDFDIQDFLEELGTPPSEKDLESEKE
ncbi:MAG: hypothetical protein ACE5GV_08650 [Candidatus Scalindua sp.]